VVKNYLSSYIMKTGNYVQGPSLPPGGRSSFRNCRSSCGKNTEMWNWQTWYVKFPAYQLFTGKISCVR